MRLTQNIDLAQEATHRLMQNGGVKAIFLPHLESSFDIEVDGHLVINDRITLPVEVRRNLRKHHTRF